MKTLLFHTYRKGMLLSSPMRFPTNELTTDADACTKRKRKDEMFLTTLVIASDLSPKCSIVIKKTNQLPNTNPFCSIIKTETESIFFNTLQSMANRHLIPYLNVLARACILLGIYNEINCCDSFGNDRCNGCSGNS